jgi:ATP-dependent protease HslVU (ClpYQ) peptidase subunit
MTVIAYRDGVVAADTMAVIDNYVKLSDEIKIAKRNGHLFGMSGDDCPKMEEVVRWFFQKNKKPLRGFKFECMVITPAGIIQQWDQRARYETLNLPFYAVGSGKEYAIGAMEVGATAQQAVEAAIKWCPTVGGKVLVRKL